MPIANKFPQIGVLEKVSIQFILLQKIKVERLFFPIRGVLSDCIYVSVGHKIVKIGH